MLAVLEAGEGTRVQLVSVSPPRHGAAAIWVQGAQGAVVTVAGEVDSASYLHVLDVLLSAVFEGTGNLVVDMTHVARIDAAGLRALESARAWLTRQRRFVLQTSPAVRKLLSNHLLLGVETLGPNLVVNEGEGSHEPFPGLFSLSVEHQPNVLAIAVAGELDIATAPELGDAS